MRTIILRDISQETILTKELLNKHPALSKQGSKEFCWKTFQGAISNRKRK